MEEKKKSYKIITWTNFQRGKKFSEKKEGKITVFQRGNKQQSPPFLL